MDQLDREILRLLQSDNRLSSAEIGQAVGLSVSAASERVRRLNGAGIIRGNHACLDPGRVGLPLCAFIFVDLAPHPDEEGFRQQLMARAEIQEIQQIAGPHCYLLKARVAGTQALQQLLADHIKSHADVLRTETVIVMETVKDTPAMALPADGALEPAGQSDPLRAKA